MKKITTGICPICYRFMPAEIEGLDMVTRCIFHGDIYDFIEKDLKFVNRFGTNRKVDPFSGLMLNITGDCNAKCKLCYYPIKKGSHVGAQALINIADFHHNYNIWLSGGEPTIHPDFIKIVRRMKNFKLVLTNGIKFTDRDFCIEFLGAAGLDSNGCYPAVLTFNHTEDQLKIKAIETIASINQKINHAMFSIADAKQMKEIYKFSEQYKDVIQHIRIRTPFCSWGQKEKKTLYLSDLSAHIPKGYKPCDDLGGNSIYNITYKKDDRYLIICSAPSINAFDINAVQAAPKMLANDGLIYPIPLGLIINEGIDAGYMHNHATGN